MNRAFPAPLARLCAKHRASAKAEVRENAKYTMDSVLRSNFAGGRIRKTETDFLKSFFGWAFAPQEGAGGMRGGFFFGFLGGRNKIKPPISNSRSLYEALLPQGSPFHCDKTGTKSILMSTTIPQECEVHTTATASIRLE